VRKRREMDMVRCCTLRCGYKAVFLYGSECKNGISLGRGIRWRRCKRGPPTVAGRDV